MDGSLFFLFFFRQRSILFQHGIVIVKKIIFYNRFLLEENRLQYFLLLISNFVSVISTIVASKLFPNVQLFSEGSKYRWCRKWDGKGRKIKKERRKKMKKEKNIGVRSRYRTDAEPVSSRKKRLIKLKNFVAVQPYSFAICAYRRKSKEVNDLLIGLIHDRS